MNATGLFGIMATVLAVAAFSTAIIYGDRTAKVIGAGTGGFANVVRAATLRPA